MYVLLFLTFLLLQSLSFKQIKHVVTVQDHHPTPDDGVLSMVVGQLQVGNSVSL